jgi:N6-adenosine-specific RNA methylase IME4
MNLDEYDSDSFSTVMADPPWRYEDQPPRGGAEKHYNLMDLEDIKNLGEEVDRITKDESHLYLWTTNSFMEEAFEVVDSWGFEQKTIITWVKDKIGVGYYFRNTTEHILFCTKGGLGTETTSIPTHFYANRTKHSKKPSEVYRMVEESSPSPKVELFARETISGWEGVGDEQVNLRSAEDVDW